MLKGIVKSIRDSFRKLYMENKWRKANTHNFTKAGRIFPISIVMVGMNTYGVLNVHYYKQKAESLRIGSYCSIADNVHFFLGGEHEYNCITTYPFRNHISNNEIAESITKGPVIIGDDVWIGYGSVILSGVSIGQGAIIGAGSTVSKNVPPYGIYAGNKILKYRFSDEIIKKLLKINFSELSFKLAQKNINLLYEELTEDNVDEILEILFNKQQ